MPSPVPWAVASGAAVFLAGARRARRGGVPPAEEALFRAANRLPDALHPPVWTVMQFGSLAAVGVTALTLRLRRAAVPACAVALAGGASWAFCKSVKRFVGRGRPDAHLDDVRVRGAPQEGLGYPSGHTAVAVTLAALGSRSASPATRRALWAAAGTTAIGRMYVGAHLPLDLVGGVAVGIISSGLAAAGMSRRAAAR